MICRRSDVLILVLVELTAAEENMCEMFIFPASFKLNFQDFSCLTLSLLSCQLSQKFAFFLLICSYARTAKFLTKLRVTVSNILFSFIDFGPQKDVLRVYIDLILSRSYA